MQGILTSTIRKIFCNNFQQKNKRLQIGITRSAPVAGDDHSLTANLAARPRLLSSGCGERVSVRALLAKLVTFASFGSSLFWPSIYIGTIAFLCLYVLLQPDALLVYT